jgi:hypothetical protein
MPPHSTQRLRLQAVYLRVFARVPRCTKMKQKLAKATPALAKSVWERQKRPSARSVARAMTLAGYDVHFVTVARWKREGWRTNTYDDHPLDIARSKLESNAPLVTGNPVPAEEKMGADEELSDAALLRQESRKLSALSAHVWDAAQPELKKLVRRRTGELALLVEALVECGQAAINALSQAEKMENAAPLVGTGSS